jgi:hypothetical protein
MKRAENAVIDGQPDMALRLAAKVPSGLRPTSDNRNRHLLDVAAASTELRRYDDAVGLLTKLRGEAGPSVLRAQRGVVCRQATLLMCCCAGDEGFVALRRRSSGNGVKPPHGALAEDFVNMSVEAGRTWLVVRGAV